MNRLTLLFIFHFTFVLIECEKKCIIDNRSEANVWEQKIVHDLENCGYGLHKPPVPNGTEILSIALHFALKSFKFDAAVQEFSTSMWTYFMWTDERLKWDPAKYGDTKKVVTTTGHIWAPGIKLINNLEDSLEYRYLWIPCELTYSGTVECVASLIYTAKCATDLRDWPYDSQYCNLEFGLVTEAARKMQINVNQRTVLAIETEHGNEWDIMDYQQTFSSTSEKQLTMKFRLDRHAEVLAALVVYPVLILSVLTFSSLFLDVRLNIRLLVICFSLFCHNYTITNLAFDIPDNTNTPPRLLLYYRGSFMVTSILTVVSFVLNVISKKEVVCPNWIILIDDFVFMKFGKYLIWPRWQTQVRGDENASKFVKGWTDFASIVNIVWIVASSITYVSLYCVFMPHPIHY